MNHNMYMKKQVKIVTVDHDGYVIGENKGTILLEKQVHKNDSVFTFYKLKTSADENSIKNTLYSDCRCFNDCNHYKTMVIRIKKHNNYYKVVTRSTPNH